MNRLFLYALLLTFPLMPGCGGCQKPADHHEEGPHIQKIHFNKELQESMGVTVIEAKKKKLSTSIEVYGSIAQDTESTVHVTSSQPGSLKKFSVEVGQTVDKDTPIAAVQTQDQKTLEILSPVHGIVMAQYVKEGEKIDNLTSIATIADPDILRASFDVYEKDISFVRMGQEVSIKTVAYANKQFSGKVTFISPRVDEETRTVKIRVDIQNDDHLLKFGMAVTGMVFREGDAEAIVVPLESVQQLDDEWAVFVKIDDETFEVREVAKGKETEEEVEILKGLNEGEAIAQKGSFTLKAEAMKDELSEGGHDH